MEPRQTGQDTVQRESTQKLDAVRSMKDECAYARKSLRKYMLGHLFRFQQNRINRHIQACALCSSEFDALKRTEETRQILKYIDLPEGVAHHVKEGVSALARLKMILYRPLWLTGIVVVVAGLFYYATLPRQIDLEIESLVKSAPAGTAAAPLADPGMVTAAVATPAAVVQTPAPAARPAPAPSVDPLAVTITPANEADAIRRINEVMGGLRQEMKFSATEREVAGALTSTDLRTMLKRIGRVATVRYDRKRLESFPGAQPIPFMLTLKAAPKTSRTPVPARPAKKNSEAPRPAGNLESAPASTNEQ